LTKSKEKSKPSLSFQAANLESLFPVLDAVAWVELPSVKQIAQFAGIDPRTAGKLLKNCELIGILERLTDDTYIARLPYPYKGSQVEKNTVLKEALLKLPILKTMKQFLKLGDSVQVSLRKAATVNGIIDYDEKLFSPLIKWAKQLDVLDPDLISEDFIEQAYETKENRHQNEKEKIIAFISHSSKDKPIIRQLASDLTKDGISVWLDEQMIRVGDSIIEKIGQGLAQSDYFLIALSDNSVKSEWVKREMNQALITEIEKRKTKVLPIKLSDCEIPTLIQDKKYADFSVNYRQGYNELIKSIKGDKNE
jgi:hypothetical protein